MWDSITSSIGLEFVRELKRDWANETAMQAQPAPLVACSSLAKRGRLTVGERLIVTGAWLKGHLAHYVRQQHATDGLYHLPPVARQDDILPPTSDTGF